MMFLIEKRGEDLVAGAREELARLEEDGVDEGEGWEGNGVGREELDEMIKRIRVPRRADAKGEEYEVKEGDFAIKPAERLTMGDTSLPVTDDGDVQMGGMHDSPRARNATQIRLELSRDLRELVERGVREMEAYDVHAQETTKVYKDALERRKGKGKSTSVPVPGGGILKNRHDEILVDRNQVQRMSTGMPLVGMVPQAQVARSFENIEEVVRRGSK